jgi:hypothetical protein
MNAPLRMEGNRPALVTDDLLALDHKHVVDSIAEIEQMVTAAPPVLEDDEDAGIVTGLMKRLIGAAKRVNEIRESEKEPYLTAGRTVDCFFNGFRDRLETAKRGLQPRLDSYMRKKAEAERRAREAAARAAAEASASAQKQISAAVDSGDDEAAQHAIEAAAEAQNELMEARASAAAKPAELARTRSEGGIATLKQEWGFQIVDFNKIDLERLRPYIPPADIEKFIRIFVRQGGRELAGVRIEQTSTTVVR